ncbi:MAG: protease inhibitor I42 family protein [Reyranellales bacterium]
MLSSIGIAFVCFAGLRSAEASADCTVELDTGEPGVADVKRGEVFSVCLPLSAGTGYMWQIQATDDAKAFLLVAEPKFETSSSLLGARGRLRFVLRPVTGGKFTLIFQLRSPGGVMNDADSVALVARVS